MRPRWASNTRPRTRDGRRRYNSDFSYVRRRWMTWARRRRQRLFLILIMVIVLIRGRRVLASSSPDCGLLLVMLFQAL